MTLYRHLWFFILTLSIPVLFSSAVKAQSFFDLAEPNFIRLNTPAVTVTGMAQSESGLQWVASDNGVYSFDGYDYKKMDYLDARGRQLNKEYITSISLGADGVMWAGTLTRGLLRIDEKNQQYRLIQHDPAKSDSLVSNHVSDILLDGDKGLWLATSKGLDYFDVASSRFRHHQFTETVGLRPVHLNFHPNGGLLIGTINGLFHFDVENNRFTPLGHNRGEDLSKKVIQETFADQLGRIWIGTLYSGAYLLQDDGELKKLGDYQRVMSIALVDGEVWLATQAQGIAVFNFKNGEFKREYRADPYRPMTLVNDEVSSIFVDDNDLVWLGGRDTAIRLVTPSRNFSRTLMYSPLHNKPALKTDVSGVVETNDGEVWISSLSQGIDVFDPHKGFKHTLTSQAKLGFNLASDNIKSLVKSRDGKLWLATTDAGLYRYKPIEPQGNARKTATTVWLRDECRFSKRSGQLVDIDSMQPLADGSILFIGSAGLFTIENTSQTRCTLTRIDTGNVYLPQHAIEIDRGRTLIAEYGTVHLLAAGANQTTELDVIVEGEAAASPPHFIGGHDVSSGTVFLSTGFDVFQVMELSSAVLRVKKVFQQPHASKPFYEDENGNIWGDGVHWLATNDETKPYRVTGSAITELGDYVGFFVTQDKLLFVAHELGLHIIRPSAFEEWRYQPPMIIRDALFGAQHQKIEQGTLVLESNKQDLSLSFAALDYSVSQSIQYRYLLEGHSATWVTANSNQRRAVFSKLAPGDYKFRLQSSDRLGAWSEQELQLAVTVLPAWYQTWAFRFLMLVMFLFGLCALYGWRLGSYRKNEVELESIIRDRSEDLAESVRDLKRSQAQLAACEKQASLGRLVNGVALEINTPLGIAKMAFSEVQENTLELVQAYEIDEVEDVQMTARRKKIEMGSKVMEHNFDRLSKLVDGFMLLSVDDSDWQRGSFCIDEWLNDVPTQLADELLERNIQLECIVAEALKVHSSPTLLKHVVLELIKNSLQHGFSPGRNNDGRICVRANIKGDAVSPVLVLRIEDNGCGIEEDLLPTIFDPFTAAKPSDLGLGLHVVVNLLRNVLQGDINCANIPSLGCCFTVSVPLRSSAMTWVANNLD